MALILSALVMAVPSASQKLTRVLPSPVSPDSSLCQLDAPLFGVCVLMVTPVPGARLLEILGFWGSQPPVASV